MTDTYVSVSVRVRPLLSREILHNEQPCVFASGERNEVTVIDDCIYSFDHAFSADADQEFVFNASVTGLLRSCFEGINVTICAYGQTGSGKTHTMGGHILSQQESLGIMPRAIDQIFSSIHETADRTFTVKVSYVEIYCEELRDLLSYSTPSRELAIRENEAGNIFLSGVKETVCQSSDEVLALLRQGAAVRQTGSTHMNEVSSRSHAVFIITVEQTWTENHDGPTGNRLEQYACAKVNFVDLAGSERARKTGNVGERFKESIHINSGLLALGNVIAALSSSDGPNKKAQHVPYRDSKITRLLKDSLGGNSKTMMICCVSPTLSDIDETLNSLKPVANREREAMKIEALRSEVRQLRDELQRRQKMAQLAGARADHDSPASVPTDLVCQLQQYRELLGDAALRVRRLEPGCQVGRSLSDWAREWLDLTEELMDASGPANVTPALVGEVRSKSRSDSAASNRETTADLQREKALEKRFAEVCAENARKEAALIELRRQVESSKAMQLEQKKRIRELESEMQHDHLERINRENSDVPVGQFAENEADVFAASPSPNGRISSAPLMAAKQQRHRCLHSTGASGAGPDLVWPIGKRQ